MEAFQNLKTIKRKEKVILLNTQNMRWVKMSSLGYEKNMVDSESFFSYLDEKFSFFKDVQAPQKIRSAYFSVTGKCNLSCEFCCMKSGPNVNTDGDLKLEEIESLLIPKLKKLGTPTIFISGGEPLVRCDILKILGVFYENFGRERVILQTNGLLLNESKVQAISKYVSCMEISIENIFENENQLAHMKTVFDSILGNECFLRFSFVISNKSSKYLSDAIDLIHQYNSFCTLRFINEVGEAVGKEFKLTHDEMLDIYIDILDYILEKEYSLDIFSEMFFCRLHPKSECGGFGRTVGIHADGEVFMCMNFHDSLFSLGNIRTEEMDEIENVLKTKKENKYIQDLFLVNNMKLCDACDIQYFCSGPCAAENHETDNKGYAYRNCEMNRLLVHFMLFEYDRKLDKNTNFRKLFVYLVTEKNKLRSLN